jgi:hypothetical protein
VTTNSRDTWNVRNERYACHNVLPAKKLRSETMEYYNDKAKLQQLRVVNQDEWAERSPYIPRRKSSNNEHPLPAASMADLRRPSRSSQQENHSQDIYLQKARFPIDGFDLVSKTPPIFTLEFDV